MVAASKITIDLQNHSITNTGCPRSNSGITDQGSPFDVIVVKNGSVKNYDAGVKLAASTRVSVLGVTVVDNAGAGIDVGPQALVKASEATGNGLGIRLADRGQVQQCNVHENGNGVFAGGNCLITMNTVNKNGIGIMTLGNRCTISFNTANFNAYGIDTQSAFTGHLITQNVALDNKFDYQIACPSDVTNNTSTDPATSYIILSGTGCHLVNNN